MSSNPLRSVTFRIPFDRIAASHADEAIDHWIDAAGRSLDDIGKTGSGQLTYENTFEALDYATEGLEWAISILGHLESVATTPELRDAYNRVRPKVSAFYSKIPLREDLWKVLSAFATGPNFTTLDATKRRFVEKTLDDFRRHGAELDAAGKKSLTEIDVALGKTTTQFSEHVLDATNAFEIIITDENRLQGLPASAVAAAKASAQEKGKPGYRFTLHAPSLTPVLRYADDARLREEVWHAYNTRGTVVPTDNRALIVEILRLRRAKARLLGYADFADFVLANRMAKTGQAASDFVDSLRNRTTKAFERENRDLVEFRRSQGDDGDMQPWDVGYWAEKERRALFDFDEEELREYFPAEAVLEGVFSTVKRLYGVSIDQDDAPTWSDSVTSYRMMDRDGSALGSFYVDLYPRDNKRGGAWMNGLITGTPPQPHLGLFCANVNPAVGDRPALLTHREVETVFHEFGHLIHHLLSKVTVRSLGGTNVAWDFVELPSQIMENWCWEREALDGFAKHYKSGAPIPDELFAKMKRARTYRAANAQMRQLGFATMDLSLHRAFDPESGVDVMKFSRDILSAHSPIELPEEYGMVAAFTHLFGDPVGYGAAYYSYKWAEVLDADAFEVFKERGIFSEDAGAAFRDHVLSRGDSDEPEVLFANFVGRDPSPEALMRRQGL